jgi:hypothetical protein
MLTAVLLIASDTRGHMHPNQLAVATLRDMWQPYSCDARNFTCAAWAHKLPVFCVQIGDGEVTVDEKSAIVTINAQGIIQLANKAAYALFG